MAMSVTPLEIAAKTRAGDVDTVREWLKQGKFDVNYVYEQKCTLLHYACEGGHLGMVRMLISEFKADTTLCDWMGCSPLHWAAKRGYEQVALALIKEFGCDTSIRGYNTTLLHSACEGGCVILVQTLVRDYNADIYAGNADRKTPLHMALVRGKRT